MFDYLRNLTKSAAEKRQEQLNAYLDGAFTPIERKRFEEQLAQDDQLRADLAQLQILKQQMGQMPRRRVPRNFILDPAHYGRPRREPLVQAYPLLRTATVLTAFLFIFALAANLFSGGGGGFGPAAESVVESVEVTRIVTETIVMEGEPVEVTRMTEETASEEGERVVVTRVVTEQIVVEEESAVADEASSGPQGFQATRAAEAKPIDETSIAAPDLGDAAEFAADMEIVEEQAAAEAPAEESLDEDRATIEALIEAGEALEATATAVATKNIPSPEPTPTAEPIIDAPQLPSFSPITLLAIGLGGVFLVLLFLLWLTNRRL